MPATILARAIFSVDTARRHLYNKIMIMGVLFVPYRQGHPPDDRVRRNDEERFFA
jgi:hypothetical protein